MVFDAKEKTALSSSVGADERQPFQTKSNSSISTSNTEINYPDENSSENLEELYRKMQRMASPYYLHTVSILSCIRPPNRDRRSSTVAHGGHILAVRRRLAIFLERWIAYHVSTGEKLWEFGIKAQCYLALRTTAHSKFMFMMYGVEDSDNALRYGGNKIETD